MGSWDCYCALCCGPLNIHTVKVGDNTTRALRQRTKLVSKRKRGDIGHDTEDETLDDEEEKERDDESKINKDNLINAANLDPDVPANYNIHYTQIPDGSIDLCYEKNSYSPLLLTVGSVKWIHQCRTIGYNPYTKAAFISGRGSYDDYGSFQVRDPGNDPNDPHPDLYECYQCGAGDIEEPTFPFHEACYRVLAKRLGYNDAAEINKDALYDVMYPFGEGNGSSLMLEYGEVKAQQYWDCAPGQEYVVCSPEDGGLELSETIWQRLPIGLLLAPPPPDRSTKIRRDLLAILPFDIVHIILQNLTVHDSLNLMRASHYINTVTDNSRFWRSMIRTHLEPWFWEIRDLVSEHNCIQECDYKGLFLWLDDISTPRFGMEGVCMGVANRRRIWVVCGQLVEAYKLALEREGGMVSSTRE